MKSHIPGLEHGISASTFRAASDIYCIMRLTFLLLLVAAAGCNSKLATGYEPIKLGTLTPAERRGLYAEDYSIEARAAQEENKSSTDDYRTKLPGGQQ